VSTLRTEAKAARNENPSPMRRTTGTPTCPTRRASFIYFSMGIIVFGPKAFEFYDDFSNYRATNLKPDGVEISLG